MPFFSEPGGGGRSFVATTLVGVFALSGSVCADEEFAEVSGDRYVEPDERMLLQDGGLKKSAALSGYYLGLSRERAGDIEGALEAFEGVLEVSPEQLMLARKAATIAGQFGEQARGRAIMERAFNKNRNNPEAYIRFSEFLATYHNNERKHTDRARAVMEDAIERFPEEPKVYDRLISLYLSNQDKQKARETLTTALDRESDDPTYWLSIARVAQRIYPLRETPTPVLVNKIYEKALKLGKGDAEIENAVADYYSLSRQFERARDLYEAILSDRPEELIVREKLARIYGLLDDMDKVLETLVELEQINPHRLETQRFIAQIYGEREDYGKAIEHWLKAFRLAKGSAAEYRAVGQMMMIEGQGEEAVELLERAQFHYPDDFQISIYLARAYNVASKYDQAYRTFKATEGVLIETESELLDFLFYFSYGAAAERSKRFEEATGLFRKSIDLVPEQFPEAAAMPYNYLGYMWLEQDKNIDEAGELIRLANQLDPNSGAYVDSLGWFYFKKGRFAEALETLLRSERMIKAEEGFDPDDPENAVIYDHIAQAFYNLGYVEEALEYMEIAIGLDSEKEEYQTRKKEYTENDPPEKTPVDFLQDVPKEDPADEGDDIDIEDAPPAPKDLDKAKSGDPPKTA